MPEPLQLPIRVIVKGPSTVNWTSYMGGPRTDFAFPRVLEQEVLAAGRPIDIRVFTAPSQRANSQLRTWEEQFLGFLPDVVVLTLGQQETIHLFLPRWLERHANSLKAKDRPLTNFYRKSILKPTWKLLARVQARVDRALPPNLRKRRPKHVAADLERLITHLNKLQFPLIYVCEFLPPAQRQKDWFPGMEPRLHVMNETIEAMVRKIDKPNVRYFTLRELVTKYAEDDIEIATPDGFHYSPEMHRAFGAKLAREILEWADTQPYLQPPAPRAAD